MPKFAYKTEDRFGQRQSGSLSADSPRHAADTLRARGDDVADIRREFDPADVSALPPVPPKRLSRDDIVFFVTQLSVMVDTGVPLDEALGAIGSQSDHSGLQALVTDIAEQVRGGVELSAALAKHPKHFDELFLALIQAAEATGRMGEMLSRAAEYMESDRETRRKVRGAMIYPACMLGFCFLTVLALMIFILPRFEKIYSGKGAVLPLPTRILLATSSVITGYWPLLLLGFGGVVGGCWWYFRTPDGRIVLDRIRLHVPVMGGMYRKAALARSLRTMATMVTSGVSMLEGLAITAKAAGNHFYARIWTELAESVQEGCGLSEKLFDYDLIPRTVTQMIDAGERTGRLGEVMNRIAHHCEEELNVAIKAMTTMIEPVMIIIMGLVIGGIALALLLPVFSIAQVVAH